MRHHGPYIEIASSGEMLRILIPCDTPEDAYRMQEQLRQQSNQLKKVIIGMASRPLSGDDLKMLSERWAPLEDVISALLALHEGDSRTLYVTTSEILKAVRNFVGEGK